MTNKKKWAMVGPIPVYKVSELISPDPNIDLDDGIVYQLYTVPLEKRGT